MQRNDGNDRAIPTVPAPRRKDAGHAPRPAAQPGRTVPAQPDRGTRNT
ncbi:hypothetical protein [Streptomyces sp. NRRL B-24484]|nr:hypothetical protein [Streptomyces sp. NRRL B-24484]